MKAQLPAMALKDELATEVARLNNIEQVQARLGVGRSTVFGLIKSHQIRSARVGRRRMVTEQSLRDFIAKLDGEPVGVA